MIQPNRRDGVLVVLESARRIGAIVTIDQMAEVFNVSRRTIDRDIRALRSQATIPSRGFGVALTEPATIAPIGVMVARDALQGSALSFLTPQIHSLARELNV